MIVGFICQNYTTFPSQKLTGSYTRKGEKEGKKKELRKAKCEAMPKALVIK